MNKVFLILFLLLSSLDANSYHFKENRYSYALDKEMHFNGIITFTPTSMSIKYEKSHQVITLTDGEVSITQKGKSVKLGTVESLQLARYLELLLLLYQGNEALIETEFSTKVEDETTTLTPKHELSAYLNRIEYTKRREKLRKLTMFLTNQDKIKIRILNEVH